MPEIVTQRAARDAQSLTFCHLCGEPFDERPRRQNEPDHIPPKKLFATQDRDFPIKVAAHESCNNAQSRNDEIIGQLVAVIHGKHVDAKTLKLNFETVGGEPNEAPYLGIKGINIEREVIRWVRGFHAALYREFLPADPDCKFCVSLPFPRLMNGPNGNALNRRLLQNHLSFVEKIRKNRKAGRLDRIVANNGRCVYECVWSSADNGQQVCIFTLNLYDWSQLADQRVDRRSCVGLYLPPKGRPKLGTEGTTLEMPISSADPLNSFTE